MLEYQNFGDHVSQSCRWNFECNRGCCPKCVCILKRRRINIVGVLEGCCIITAEYVEQYAEFCHTFTSAVLIQ